MADTAVTLATVARHVEAWAAGALSPFGLDWSITDLNLPDDESDLDFSTLQYRGILW